MVRAADWRVRRAAGRDSARRMGNTARPSRSPSIRISRRIRGDPGGSRERWCGARGGRNVAGTAHGRRCGCPRAASGWWWWRGRGWPRGSRGALRGPGWRSRRPARTNESGHPGGARRHGADASRAVGEHGRSARTDESRYSGRACRYRSHAGGRRWCATRGSWCGPACADEPGHPGGTRGHGADDRGRTGRVATRHDRRDAWRVTHGALHRDASSWSGRGGAGGGSSGGRAAA